MRTSGRMARIVVTFAIALGGMLAAPSEARASGCTEVVGKAYSLDANGTHIGVFYQGYDQCNRNAYAEVDFADTWVASQADGSSKIDIYHEMYSNGTWYVNGPGSGYNNNPPWWSNNAGYPNSWASPAVTINYASGNQRFRATFYLEWWTGNRYYECDGSSDWDYTNGSNLGGYGSCGAVA